MRIAIQRPNALRAEGLDVIGITDRFGERSKNERVFVSVALRSFLQFLLVEGAYAQASCGH
jgi:hypothetical protein